MSISEPASASDAELDLGLAEMRGVRAPLRDAASLTSRGANALSVIEATLARERTRTRTVRVVSFASAGLLVAALALLSFHFARPESPSKPMKNGELVAQSGELSLRPPSGAERLLREGTREELVAGTSISAGPSANGVWTSRSGVTVFLSTNSTVSFPDGSGQRIIVLDGRVDVEVPPLERGASFQVEAFGSKVTVHGTSFSVFAVPNQTEPCVTVREGLVSVENSGLVWLKGGESDHCPRATDPAPSKSGESESISKGEPSTRSRTSAPSSTLALENRLFQEALLLLRRGEKGEAERKLTSFLTKYPSSPLATRVRTELESLRRRDPR